MNAADLRTLVEYGRWARARMLDALDALTPEQYARAMGNSFDSVRDTVVHIYGAEWIWTARLDGESPAAFPTVGDLPDVATLRRAWAALDERVDRIVSSLDDAGAIRTIEYRTMSFGPAASTVAQILQHVANHGTYHRGQVTTMVRQLGAAAPKATDLIFFYRERASGST